jgi:uncharacterized membrane protein
MKMRILLSAASVFALSLLWSAKGPLSSASWTFTPIDVPGADRTYARDMNSGGQIVGFFEKAGPPFVRRGYLLSDGVFTPLEVGDYSDARGINSDGAIVGLFYSAADGYAQHGFLLSEGIVTQIDLVGADLTFPEAINATGDIVGYYVIGDTEHAFLLRDGVYTTIDYPGAILTNARGINTGGDIVGLYKIVDPDGRQRFHGFVRSRNGTFTTINGPGALGGNANGINSRSWVVGEYSLPTAPGQVFGFLLAQGEYTLIDYPDATITRPWKITPDGKQIVGFYDDLHGFLASRKP